VRMGPSLVGLQELDDRLAAGEQHPLLGRASVHASLIEGGQELSTYPERCVVKLERRTLPGESVASVEEELRAVAKNATVRSFFSREPLETPRDAEIVQLLSAHAGAPEVVGVPFWTDAALFAAAGIPTVVFGPRGDGLHTESEWVDLDSLERVREILLATAIDFCS
jgi:acetylornithine deacetylase/succinyl-diaminopimelate desuccinylase-like protein